MSFKRNNYALFKGYNLLKWDVSVQLLNAYYKADYHQGSYINSFLLPAEFENLNTESEEPMNHAVWLSVNIL